MNDYEEIKASEMISRLYKNIDEKEIEKSGRIINTWRYAVESIKSNSLNGDNLGKKISAHSKVVDLKNGVLLIEVDHSGWIQLIQTYQKYIKKYINSKIPELKIDSIAFRLKGTEYGLFDEKDSISKEKERLQKRFDEEENILRKFDENSKIRQKKELPESIKKIFDEIEKDMLTNSDKI